MGVPKAGTSSLWLILALYIQAAYAALTQKVCGEYCSCRHTKRAYVGYVDEADELRRALHAASFKNEVIITSETRPELAAGFVSRFASAGYCHLLVHTPDQVHCRKLTRVVAVATSVTNLSCAYYRVNESSAGAGPWGFVGPADLLVFRAKHRGQGSWFWKWYSAARAVVLGYNVMAVDADSVVLGDFYSRVKQWPASLYTMLTQAESPVDTNGGFTYVQNARSNGPVAFMLMELMHRTVRLLEDSRAVRNLTSHAYWPHDYAFPVDDQNTLSDVMNSCASGRPVFWNVFGHQTDPEWQRSGMRAFRGAIMSLAMKAYSDRVYSVGGQLASEVFYSAWHPTGGSGIQRSEGQGVSSTGGAGGSNVSVTIRTVDLSMPHAGGVWPKELIGNPFMPPGPYTARLRKSFTDLGRPLPPDPEDPAQEAEARAAPHELMALLAGGDEDMSAHAAWLEGSYGFSGGPVGSWHTHLRPRFYPAIGHMHVAAVVNSIDDKGIALKLAGHYDWAVASMIHGRGHVYYACLEGHMHTRSLGRVVAYKPGVIHSKLGFDDFLRAVEGLARLALLFGAVAAWPAVPCDAPWVLRERVPGGVPSSAQPGHLPYPWHHINTQFRAHPFGPSLDHMQCEWGAFMNQGCLRAEQELDGGRGLLAVEMAHLMEQDRGWALGVQRLAAGLTHGLGGNGGRVVRQEIVLQCMPGAEPEVAANPPGGMDFTTCQSADLVSLNAERILQAQPTAVAVPLIIWVDRLLEVQGMTEAADKRYNKWHERCPALHYKQLKDPFNKWW